MTSASNTEASDSSALPGRCERCQGELVSIQMMVDGDDLVMESCKECDTRRWHLAGHQIDLHQALARVGERARRRR
ncbi:MAG: hypothetical protein AAF467_12050 [Actinomycetota bacterium]